MTFTHLLLLLVGAVVGLIAERLLNRALPYGWIGAIVAGAYPDLDEAAAFLRELSDNEFQFVTALAVLHAATQKMLDRILFIAFSEKRGLLPPDSIATAFRALAVLSTR